MYVNSSTGNRETSTLAAREVSRPHREGDEPKPMMHGDEGSDSAMSHCEASERGRATGRGVRGAKGGGRGERGTGRHAPDTEPARRVPRPGPRAASRTLRRQHPRWEPDALIGPVRFCAGGAQGVPTAIGQVVRRGDALEHPAREMVFRRVAAAEETT